MSIVLLRILYIKQLLFIYDNAKKVYDRKQKLIILKQYEHIHKIYFVEHQNLICSTFLLKIILLALKFIFLNLYH